MLITSDILKRHRAPGNGGKVKLVDRLASPPTASWEIPSGNRLVLRLPVPVITTSLPGPITRLGALPANESNSNNSSKRKSLYPGLLPVINGFVHSSQGLKGLKLSDIPSRPRAIRNRSNTSLPACLRKQTIRPVLTREPSRCYCQIHQYRPNRTWACA